MNIRKKLKLYFIMGSTNCLQDPLFTLEQAIQGGITLFQFREKGEGALVGDERIELAIKLKEICHRNDIPFIINDDVELATLVNADGVHIGQDDEAFEYVRKKIGNKIIGVSCHNEREAKEAIRNGADYIGVGPMFPTKTKLDAHQVIGPSIISQIRASNLTVPITGIGGITQENASKVIQAGADGVAVISAISYHQDPKQASEQLKSAISKKVPYV